MPVLYGLQIHDRLPERLGPALLAIAPLTVAAAALSWYLVERPAIRFAARVPAPRRASRAAPRSQPQPAES